MPLNFFFFGAYFFLVSALYIAHIFLTDPILLHTTYLLALYGVLQSALETLFLIIINHVIASRWPRFLNLYAFLVLFLFLSHLIDFPLSRLVDMSFWYALGFVLEESYANFIELLISSNISLVSWLMALIGAILLPAIGILAFRITHKRSLHIRKLPLVITTISCLGFLLILDYKLNNTLPLTHVLHMHKAFPWKQTFFAAAHPELAIPSALKTLPSQEERLLSLDSSTFSLLHKPDIYLIIIESLRSDFINEVNTPNLYAFKEQNLNFPLTFSNANATHLSWFSLFYSEYPFRWENPQSLKNPAGSLPLVLLKKMGYKIHVASSSNLSYYQMDEILFGKDRHLADSLFTPSDSYKQIHERDTLAVNRIVELSQSDSVGNVFILSLDASHFDYSFPDACGLFTPYDDSANYLQALFSKQAPPSLINRYQNALLFIDSEIGRLLNQIPKDAVVIITGDHGEEFYEKGNLFHNSILTKEQITPPIFYRFPSLTGHPTCSCTCHMDIFPSLLHYLTGSDVTTHILEGQSIFKKERWPFTVIGRFNASRTPTQYCIHKDAIKLTLSFDTPNPFDSKQLRLLSTKTLEDDTIPFSNSSLDEEFGPAFDHLFPVR